VGRIDNPRKIPQPAGKGAGLRDDAIDKDVEIQIEPLAAVPTPACY